MVMLHLKKLARRKPRRTYLAQSVRNEVASMARTDALETYVCGKRKKRP